MRDDSNDNNDKNKKPLSKSKRTSKTCWCERRLINSSFKILIKFQLTGPWL